MSHPSLFVSAMKLSNCQYTVQGRIKGCKTDAGKSENIVYISCAYAAVIEKGMSTFSPFVVKDFKKHTFIQLSMSCK